VILLFSSAVALACPPTAAEVARARAAFDDAEVEAAGRLIEAAVEDLGCQTEVVQTATLLALYRLDGMVALSRMNEKSAVYATIRAVTVDPGDAPPPEYGPELADLHRVWSDRLSSATAVLDVNGGGTVYVDGRPVTHGGRLTVLQGEHVVQVVNGQGLVSDVRDVTGDLTVNTGLPAPIGPNPVPLDEVPDRPKPVGAPRKRPVPVWIAGAGAMVVGGALVGVASGQEAAFKERIFPDVASVDRAASRVRVAYAAGYGVSVIGIGLLATNAVGLPASASVTLRW
jgi:hypothetical protein